MSKIYRFQILQTRRLSYSILSFLSQNSMEATIRPSIGVVREFMYRPDFFENLCYPGFYIDSTLFPAPTFPVSNVADDSNRLLLGPFCGKPACQFINTAPGKARGVCADAFLKRETLVVPEVDLYPGHIACDGETKSEIVVPLVHKIGDHVHNYGVLDLDCLAVNGFTEEDRIGLERIVDLIVNACNW